MQSLRLLQRRIKDVSKYTTRRGIRMGARIVVDNNDALVDEVINIRVRDLGKYQPITIRAETEEKNQRFVSCASFVANGDGVVDVAQEPSHAGTYTGVSSMGLFWSMIAMPGQRPGTRLLKPDASTPWITKLSVFDGHLDFQDTYSTSSRMLHSIDIRRWYLAADVHKIPVRVGRVTGTLFVPPGRGPFPGVLDILGLIGNLLEYRAALLASRGFVTLALPYLNHLHLPHDIGNLELEYFLEALDWFATHPAVTPGGVGALGLCKGGEIVQHIAYESDQVRTAAIINGAPFITGRAMKYKGEQLGHGRVALDKLAAVEGGYSVKGVIVPEMKENFLPLWKRDTTLLLMVGGDDQCLSPDYVPMLHESYQEHGVAHKCDLVVYPGAGHLIEPPYAPLNPVANFVFQEINGVEMTVVLGGNPVDHAKAQENSWRRIIQHFRTHLQV